MKKTTLVMTITAILTGVVTFGQGGNTGHISTSGEFLGWNGTGTSQPLEIRNDFNQPISLQTNGSERIMISNGSYTDPVWGLRT